MGSPVYYSPNEKDIYKSMDVASFPNVNQRIYIWNEWKEYQRLAQKRHEEMFLKLHGIEERVKQSYLVSNRMQCKLLNQVINFQQENHSFKQITRIELNQLDKQLQELHTKINQVLLAKRADVIEQNVIKNQIIQKLNSMCQQLKDEILILNNEIHSINEGVRENSNLLYDRFDELEKDRAEIVAMKTRLNELVVFEKKLRHWIEQQLKLFLIEQEKLHNDLENHKQQLQKQLRFNKDELESSLDKIHEEIATNMEAFQNELRKQTDELEELDSRNETQTREIQDQLTEIKELLQEDNPYKYFKTGNRITILDRYGNQYTGTFIKDTENEIIWVNDANMRLSITNKRGVTVSKET